MKLIKTIINEDEDGFYSFSKDFRKYWESIDVITDPYYNQVTLFNIYELSNFLFTLKKEKENDGDDIYFNYSFIIEPDKNSLKSFDDLLFPELTFQYDGQDKSMKDILNYIKNSSELDIDINNRYSKLNRDNKFYGNKFIDAAISDIIKDTCKGCYAIKINNDIVLAEESSVEKALETLSNHYDIREEKIEIINIMNVLDNLIYEIDLENDNGFKISSSSECNEFFLDDFEEIINSIKPLVTIQDKNISLSRIKKDWEINDLTDVNDLKNTFKTSIIKFFKNKYKTEIK